MKRLILSIGLLGLVGCKDVRTEYSEPIRTEVSISQRYVPPRSETTIGMCYDAFDGSFSPCLETEHYPAEYITTIRSNKCTQTFNDSRIYDHFKYTKPETLEYVDVYRNTYGQRPNAGEEEIILLESHKTGCKLLGL